MPPPGPVQPAIAATRPSQHGTNARRPRVSLHVRGAQGPGPERDRRPPCCQTPGASTLQGPCRPGGLCRTPPVLRNTTAAPRGRDRPRRPRPRHPSAKPHQATGHQEH
ncbi:hypothetical protein NDU88_008307 [Pleurodeles waltl]|uniref:Uncharacterized protein n=1 Tax=Pleurodeles waltl TaxID=8319 RepID=A0AAV7U651_PLEWA|nr:hypothetical protein NDU88_008307 [Pleurodeles waltl]